MSSYKINNYKRIFKYLAKISNTTDYLEIGILDGYTLEIFNNIKKIETIVAIDLFEKYSFKHAKINEIKDKFKNKKKTKIIQGDFFNYYKKLNNQFDIIHIDISNDGIVYEFAFKKYFKFCTQIMLLEGGSEERDNIDWMVKFKKKKILPVLNKYRKLYNIINIVAFPSLTIIIKNDQIQIYQKLKQYLKLNKIEFNTFD